MRMVGQICLLVAFVSVGFSAFACMFGIRTDRQRLLRNGLVAGIAGILALTIVMAVLAHALLAKDFNFQYVAEYSNRALLWHYSLSALWVGQAGSLLLWTWMLGVLTLLFRFWPWKVSSVLRDPAFGILMAFCGFLTAILVFAADPMEANIAPGQDGAGLSPLLQHPAMLIHPPIVFGGYAAWAIPCALAIAALTLKHKGNDEVTRSIGLHASSARTSINPEWVRIARPWALVAWTVLGGGILLGAYWSYEELGWGGYWAWDPVENGSLIPWLIGSAFIHTLMAWQFRGMLKKMSVALAIACFGMCNFATFLTRSGIFSSLHAFSESPIGWLFLGFMLLLGFGGIGVAVRQQHGLRADNSLTSLWSREAFIMVSIVALLLMAAITVAGTLSVALSEAIFGRRVMVGPAFYNTVAGPLGLLLLATMGAAPLLRWGAPPLTSQRRALVFAALVAAIVSIIFGATGTRQALGLAVAGLAAFSLATLIASLCIESWRHCPKRPWQGLIPTLITSRRTYAAFAIHLGFVCIAVGVTGSSLGSRREEFILKPGEAIEWSGQSIRFVRLIEKDMGDKFIVEAELEVTRHREKPFRLLPAQHFHRLQDQWTTEVAIHSTWGSDLYSILHSGEGNDAIRLTLVINPMMRWMWVGGWVIALGTAIRILPAFERSKNRPPTRERPAPQEVRLKQCQRQPDLVTARTTTTPRVS